MNKLIIIVDRLNLITAFFLIGFIFYSCDQDNINSNSFIEAEVMGKNRDCGLHEIKIIQGNENVKSILETTSLGDIYIAKNLPENLKIEGLKIKIDIRQPKNNEFGVCTHLGPSYKWLYIIKAEKK